MRKKSTPRIKMLPLAEFLAEIELAKHIPKKP